MGRTQVPASAAFSNTVLRVTCLGLSQGKCPRQPGSGAPPPFDMHSALPQEPPKDHFLFRKAFFLASECFGDGVSLCSAGWSQTCGSCVCASRVLGSEAWATAPGFQTALSRGEASSWEATESAPRRRMCGLPWVAEATVATRRRVSCRLPECGATVPPAKLVWKVQSPAWPGGSWDLTEGS